MNEFLNDTSKLAYGKLNVGESIVDVSGEINNILYNHKNYRPVLPMTIEMGAMCCNSAPFVDYKLRESDSFTFTLGLKSRKECIKIATPKIIGENDAAFLIRKAIMHAFRGGMSVCGPDVYCSEITDVIEEILDSYEIKSINNLCGHSLDDMGKLIPNCSPIQSMYKHCSWRLKEGERIYLDVYGTNLDTHMTSLRYNVPTIYKICDTPTPMAQREFTSKLDMISRGKREMVEWCRRNFGTSPFSARSIFDNFKNANQKKVENLYNRGIILPIPSRYINVEKEDIMKCISLHFGRTLVVGSSGAKLIE